MVSSGFKVQNKMCFVVHKSHRPFECSRSAHISHRPLLFCVRLPVQADFIFKRQQFNLSFTPPQPPLHPPHLLRLATASPLSPFLGSKLYFYYLYYFFFLNITSLYIFCSALTERFRRAFSGHYNHRCEKSSAERGWGAQPLSL